MPPRFCQERVMAVADTAQKNRALGAMGEALFITLPLHQMSHTVGKELLSRCQGRFQRCLEQTGDSDAVGYHCNAVKSLFHCIFDNNIHSLLHPGHNFRETFSSWHAEIITQNFPLLVIRFLMNLAGKTAIIFAKSHFAKLIKNNWLVLRKGDSSCHLTAEQGTAIDPLHRLIRMFPTQQGQIPHAENRQGRINVAAKGSAMVILRPTVTDKADSDYMMIHFTSAAFFFSSYFLPSSGRNRVSTPKMRGDRQQTAMPLYRPMVSPKAPAI